MGPDTPRSLGDRRFLLTARVPHPFIATQFTFRQGVASVVLGDRPTPLSGGTADQRLIAAVERIGVQVGLSPVVGLTGAFSGQVATGIDGDSALYGGAQAGVDWELGATWRVYRSDQLQVAVLPGLYGSEGADVVPATVVASAFEAGSQSAGDDDPDAFEAYSSGLTDDIVQPLHTFGGGVAGAVAWRLAPRLGLIGGLRLRAGESRTATAKGLPLSLSAGAAIDARLAENHPLVGQVELRYRSIVDAGLDAEATVEDRLESRWFSGAGIYWRGRHEAELGMSAWGLLRAGASDDRLLAAEAVIRVFL